MTMQERSRGEYRRRKSVLEHLRHGLDVRGAFRSGEKISMVHERALRAVEDSKSLPPGEREGVVAKAKEWLRRAERGDFE